MACLVFTVSASAQPVKASAEPLAVTLVLKRVQANANGKEQLVDAPSVKPGELVEYQALYANKSAQPWCKREGADREHRAHKKSRRGLQDHHGDRIT